MNNSPRIIQYSKSERIDIYGIEGYITHPEGGFTIKFKAHNVNIVIKGKSWSEYIDLYIEDGKDCPIKRIKATAISKSLSGILQSDALYGLIDLICEKQNNNIRYALIKDNVILESSIKDGYNLFIAASTQNVLQKGKYEIITEIDNYDDACRGLRKCTCKSRIAPSTMGKYIECEIYYLECREYKGNRYVPTGDYVVLDYIIGE